jgi:N-acetylneuraminic acid mutarotase
MHVARSGLGGAVVDGKIYAIGGSTESGENVNLSGFLGTNEEYDPATDTWTFKASLPTPRAYLAITAYQGKVYCFGGITAYDLKTGIAITTANEVYDPATDTWTTKTPLPTPRAGRQASVVGDKIYLIDRLYNGSSFEIRIQIYDPARDSWTVKSSLPTGPISDVSAVFNKKIYFTSGYWAETEIYDTQTGNWSFGAPPPSAVYEGAAAATTGAFAPIRIYFFGLRGFMYQGAMPNRVYDPKSGSWTLGAEVPTNRMGFAVAVVNDIIYAIGGRSYTFPYPADSPYIITQSAANEAYTPIGYGTPDPDYKPPTPSPTPNPSASPSPTASGQQPASSPNPQQTTLQPELIYATATAATITIVAVAAVALKKRHQKNTS